MPTKTKAPTAGSTSVKAFFAKVCERAKNARTQAADRRTKNVEALKAWATCTEDGG